MRRLLKLHPDFHCSPVTQIEVDVARPDPDSLATTFTIFGKMDDIRIPRITTGTRSDGLWRHTCFEAFVGTPSGTDYYELNFAPSTQWAAYRFSGYRTGMKVISEIRAIPIATRLGPGAYTLQTSVALSAFADLSHRDPWRIGLSAIIEETSGQRSYWALTHPPGKPDFHHRACFALELTPMVRS